uniref:Venom protein n=1 Tax=Hemiscolopendra marginata TaxID=943146 RepID=A0A646QCE5_9MYRI
MKIFLLSILLGLPTYSASQEKEEFFVKVNVTDVVLKERNVHIIGEPDAKTLKINVEKTESEKEVNIVLDFNRHYSLLTEKNGTYCVVHGFTSYFKYKDAVDSLKTMASYDELDLDSCEYKIVHKSELLYYGAVIENHCSTNEINVIYELYNCQNVPETDLYVDLTNPVEVISRANKDCKVITYICDTENGCYLGCIRRALSPQFKFEKDFTVGTAEGEDGKLKGYYNRDDAVVFASIQIFKEDIRDETYDGTTYLEIRNGISTAASYYRRECGVIKLPEDMTIRKIFKDFRKFFASPVTPVVQCNFGNVQNISYSDKVAASALFQPACVNYQPISIHDCKRIPEEELEEGYVCRFVILMYIADVADLYCILQ